jgi:hypothetical protein
MHTATGPSMAKFRGVLCRYCNRAIALTASIVMREWCARVFPLRCKACEEEAIYNLNQVTDFLQDR